MLELLLWAAPLLSVCGGGAVDRIEEGVAVVVLDAGPVAYLPAALLPGAREDDVLSCRDGAVVVDHDETEARREATAEIIERLRAKAREVAP